MRRRALVVIILAAMAIAVAVFVLSRPPRPEPLPSPNGYDVLVKVAGSLVPNPGNWRTQSVDELRAALAPNSNALMAIRGALQQQWAVPVSYESNYMDSVLSNLTAAKVLANLFCAKGRAAELIGRTNDSVNAFADCIQLGQKMTQRAPIIHDLVGIACKAIGREAIRPVWPEADDATLQRLLEILSEMDRSNISPEEIIRRDYDWARGTDGALQALLGSIVFRSPMREGSDKLRAKHLRSEAEIRLLRTDVAIELFRRKNHRIPMSLDELIPKFLEAVPFDPFTAKPLLYRSATNSYVLYSLGPDRKDDGGKQLMRGTAVPFGVTEVETGDIVSAPPSQR